MSESAGGAPLLEVTDLVKHFPIKRGILIDREVDQVRAVDGVSFRVERGETLGLVGESGSGKSTACRAVLQLIKPTSGSVKFEGREIAGIGRRQARELRSDMQMVFQDPYASLDPRSPVGDSIGDGLRIHGIGTDAERRAKVERMMDMVGLQAYHARRYPHEFSGGQRQRIGIARALAVEPKLIVCDEPVSALDVSVQAQIINLFMQLRREHELTYVFISHNLAVVEHMSDRVVIMYLGRIVESGAARDVFAAPNHPYT
ncbi:MAG TPA: ATP-binding cassette domain-containing protein, partial [Sphingomicrobium sp.]|nr:ATP-binding cassette domain-containing protein [Sphingomicrobium sp.]